MTNSKLTTPNAPKLQQALPVWNGRPTTDVELLDCNVTEKDFVATKKLFIEDCTLSKVIWTSAHFDKLEVIDAAISRLEAAGVRAPEVNFLRVTIEDTRFTGADFAEGYFEDCIFKNVKFDEAGLRFAQFKRVVFDQCIFRQTDFSGAKFSHVRFSDCELDETNFDQVTCQMVDLQTADLSRCKGVMGLKGAIISDEQLVQIAPLLAVELGFKLIDQE